MLVGRKTCGFCGLAAPLRLGDVPALSGEVKKVDSEADLAEL